MNLKLGTLAGLVVATLAVAPLAAADHGLYGSYVSDSGFAAGARYLSGGGTTQVFEVRIFAAQDTCSVFGNIEVGFTTDNLRRCGSGKALTISGTGHLHVYPSCEVDQHDVVITYDGASFSAISLYLPDIPCNPLA